MYQSRTYAELNELLDEAYHCKADDLQDLLQKIELEIKNSHSTDNILLRAKMIVTSKIAQINSK